MIKDKQVKFFELAKNTNPGVTKSEAAGGIRREGKKVHVNMIAIRSHFAPDNLEGVMVGDTVLFHVTNIEQDTAPPGLDEGVHEALRDWMDRRRASFPDSDV